MKFSMYGQDFMKLINRISGIVPKKSSFPVLESVRFVAKEKTVEVHATDMDNFAIIEIFADVYEVGETWVYLSDLKKLRAINDDVIVSADGIKFDVRSAKKSYELPCRDFSEVWNFNQELENDDVICEMAETDLLNYLSALHTMKSDDFTRVFNSFYFDLPNSKIVAIDGYRIGMACMDTDDCIIAEESRPLNVSGDAYENLKSVIGKPKNNWYTVKISADKKRVMFKGNDYTYICMIVDGIYPDYSNLVSNNVGDHNYCYKVNPSELGNIAKEYGKVVKGTRKPMFIYNKDGSVATGVVVSDYRTSDSIESVESEYGMHEEWCAGFNPKFIEEACNMYKDEVKIYGNYSNKRAILFSGKTYDCVVLPVNIDNLDVEFVKKQVA